MSRQQWWTEIVKPEVMQQTELQDAWLAPSGEGDFAYTWQDKPHRVIYRLLAHIAYMQDEQDTTTHSAKEE